PAYRRRGIGSALVARCLARCGAAEVFVLLGGPAEAAFYARFGFTAPVRALARPGPRPGGGAPGA
ncbi:MAG TPA: GNAT family N-acetyltransferase, partial [Thermomicrobiales bacterium]|nr:GNAT family N-acetyltransferase [Thermomicrobiales bacterium]